MSLKDEMGKVNEIIRRLQTFGWIETFEDPGSRRELYPSYPLRHVSAKYFMGDSKVLDGREDLICKVLGVTECPFPESPVQMQVRLPAGDFEGILLVENAVSFEQLVANTMFPETAGLAIVQAHGFKGAAKRIRRRGGCSLYFAPSSLEAQFLGLKLLAM